MLKKGLDRIAIGGVEADTEARLNTEGDAAEHDLRSKLTTDPGQQCDCFFPASPEWQDQTELITPESGHRVVGTQRLSEPLPENLEQLVACRVPQSVVDFFEVVKVDEHQGSRNPSSAACQRVLGCAPEQLAVGQTSQRIVEGLVFVVG